MAVCECGHSEERHDPEDGICLGADCECEEFIEMYNEEGGNRKRRSIHEDNFYAEEVFEDDELIPEDEDERRRYINPSYFTQKIQREIASIMKDPLIPHMGLKGGERVVKVASIRDGALFGGHTSPEV